MENLLKLKSKEGDIFEIEQAAAIRSVLIKTVLEDSSEDEIPLPNISSEILTKVIEYLNYHKSVEPRDIRKPLPHGRLEELVPEWDANFIDLPVETLKNMILASNYLDIKPLLELASAKVAALMKGKTVEELRVLFDVENDYTPEEDEALRQENRWAEEES